MSAKPYRMTPEVRSQIIASIRAGAYPHVAAEAWGMSKESFEDWLRRGQEKRPREPYRSFVRDVRLAHAQARVRAEMAVFEAEPKLWLIHGPGRERDESLGWSVSVKPAEASSRSRNVLLDPDLMPIFHALAEALAPFPEARERASQSLLKFGLETPWLGGPPKGLANTPLTVQPSA